METTPQDGIGGKARAATAILLALGLAAAVTGPAPADPVAGPSTVVVGDGAASCSAAKIAAGLAPAPVPASLASTNFDATYYHLDLTLGMTDSTLAGTVRIQGVVTGSSLQTLTLDLDPAMTVDGVALPDATPLVYDHPGAALAITLPGAEAPGTTVAVDVTYHGVSAGAERGLVFGTLSKGGRYAWTLSEPYLARTWWPCKDHPSDKADSVRVTVTVPSQYLVGSQGLLRSATPSGGNTTYDWSSNYPIATYLVSLAAAAYVQYDQTYDRPASLAGTFGPLSLPIEHLVYDDVDPTLPPSWDGVSDALAVEEDWFGPYPFAQEKYGHCEFTFSGGMENQTMSSIGGANISLIVHELAHQWFGDCISLKQWPDLWLNEGFASYAELIYLKERPTAYPGSYASVYSSHYFGATLASGTLVLQDTTSVFNMFDVRRVYSKGAMVLHMLNYVTGDSTFKDILRTYTADPSLRYRGANTADFQRVAETVSGMDLSTFFRQWITDGTGFPSYAASSVWREEGGGYRVWVTVSQEQVEPESNTPVFEMPLWIAIYQREPSGNLIEIHREQVQNDRRSQVYVFDVPAEPGEVRLDPDQDILHNKYINSVTGPLPSRTTITGLGPSPTSGALQLQLLLGRSAPVDLEVINVQGRRVLTQRMASASQGAQITSLDVSHLPSGVYFLRVDAAGGAASARFVVVH